MTIEFHQKYEMPAKYDREDVKRTLYRIVENQSDRVYDDDYKNGLRMMIDCYLGDMFAAGIIYDYEFDCQWERNYFDIHFIIYESVVEKFEGYITGKAK